MGIGPFMHFEGEALRAILRRQVEPVTIIDHTGKEHHGNDARTLAGTILDNMAGVGNKRRVRFVKPTDAAIVAMRRAHADMREVMRHDPRPEHVHRNPQERGAKIWVAQFVNARSGQAGGLRKLMRPRGR